MPENLWSLCLIDKTLVAPGQVWSAWSLAPETLVPLLLALGLLPFCRQRGMYLLGWGFLLIALVSPLCRLAATLVAGHMVQFMVLLVPASLCLAWGLGARRRGGVTLPTLAYGLAIWLWHLPGLYALILRDPLAHLAAYLLLIFVSLRFWQAVLASRGAGLLALAATLAHSGLLGALLTFAGRPLYGLQAGGALLWNLTPLEDQQLAGLIMWVPGAALYLAVGLALGLRWLRRDPAYASDGALP